MKSYRYVVLFLTCTLVSLGLGLPQGIYQVVHAHCQIPCGIYDDYSRIQSMLEDADTIIKSTKSIEELSGHSDAQSLNQISRWVTNKETHSQNIISTISDYFMTQRIKPTQEDYTERLVKHHGVILAAMKAKQNADKEHATALKQSIEALATYYPEAEK
ncbi:MAG: superoxide dismutase, Ni [Candidatus Poribacteria bacterium]|nr:superoxide dismutase, Ni [Candidatus Poribacteria bacterium]|tara:strand:+ start:212 stop:688 length:477 start_codon:yes stop_codon:yes gene_type:complete